MLFKQLGNGGAFDFKNCNSSFLIDLKNELLLVDCGYSVFAELRKQDENNEISLKNLKYVYITHMDDDHMGSLKTLIYYQYFVNNITLKVIFDSNLFNEINNYVNFKSINNHTIKENYKYIIPKQKLVSYKLINNYINLNGFKLYTFKGDHHKDCYGLIIRSKNKSLAITGDTLASKEIEFKCEDCDLVFHDFSFWNEPSKQVHACEDNINITYSKKFIEKLEYYHNSKPFNNKWREL